MRLHLDITNNCNFHCKTCIREYHHGDNLDLKLLNKLLPQARTAGFTNISFTGGEPALHPHFEQIVNLVVNNNMNYSFVSNGFFLDKYKFFLHKYRKYLNGASFSLDGATREIHDKIRQKGSYDRVIESINYFRMNNADTYIIMCLNKHNKHQIIKMLKLALSLKVKGVKFTSAITTGFNKEIVLSEEEKLKCFIQINESFKHYRNKINVFITHALYTKGGLNFCSRMNELSTLTVNPKGDIIFCCDTVGYGYVVGSLSKVPFLRLYDKYINEVYLLKRERLQIIVQGKKIKGLNTCEFCNYYYKTRNKKHV